MSSDSTFCDHVLRMRPRTACVSQSIGAHLWMGRQARGSRRTIALLEVRR